MLGDAVRSMPDIVQVFRERIRALGITYATVDSIAGIADGLTAKMLSEPPQKAMGARTMVLIAGALGICFVPIVDHQQAALVQGRWTKRRRTTSDKPALQCVAGSAVRGDAPNIERRHLHVERIKASERAV
ncbi:hypothetical protein ABIC07_005015 [Bradyrhizobium sp. RT9a]